jgi:hypothetical protein
MFHLHHHNAYGLNIITNITLTCSCLLNVRVYNLHLNENDSTLDINDNKHVRIK